MHSSSSPATCHLLTLTSHHRPDQLCHSSYCHLFSRLLLIAPHCCHSSCSLAQLLASLLRHVPPWHVLPPHWPSPPLPPPAGHCSPQSQQPSEPPPTCSSPPALHWPPQPTPQPGQRLPPEGVVGSNYERTFIAIKPDGVQRGLINKIIARFEEKGFQLVGLKLIVPTEGPRTRTLRGSLLPTHARTTIAWLTQPNSRTRKMLVARSRLSASRSSSL